MKTRDVKAFAALNWVKAAWQLFAANPAGWLAIIGAWLGMTLGLMILPGIGSLALALLTPICVGGMMIACRDQVAGAGFSAKHLFAAFKENGRALMAVGSLTFLCEMAIVMGMFGLGVPTPPKLENMEAVAIYLTQLKGHEGTMLLALAALLVAKGLLWFTVPLLALHKMPFTHALRWSLFAGFSNIGAGLVFIALLALAYIPVFLSFGLGLVVVVPLFFICGYTSYVSVFDLTDEADNSGDANKSGTADEAVPPNAP